MTLYLQVKEYEYAITSLDNTMIRQKEWLEGIDNFEDPGVKQDLLCNSHINDYIQVMYRLELMGEGMGDRWDQVFDLFKHTHKTLLSPMDRVYQSILFSVTGKGDELNSVLSDANKEELEEKWKSYELRKIIMIHSFIAESTVKWSHIGQKDRENDLLINDTTSRIINAIVELNNVRCDRVFTHIGTL